MTMSGTQTQPKTALGDWLKNKPGTTAAPSASAPKVPAAASSSAAPTKADSGGGFFVHSSEIDREWDLGKHLVRIEKAEDYRSGAGKESFKVRLVGVAGAMKNAGIDDYWPKEGRGLRKTHCACKAIGLVDSDNNISIPGGAEQMIGRELWVEILAVNETYRDSETGEERSRVAHKIGFTSYWPKSAFEVPVAVEGDLFADGAAEGPVAGGGTARTMFKGASNEAQAEEAADGEVVGVEAGAPAF